MHVIHSPLISRGAPGKITTWGESDTTNMTQPAACRCPWLHAQKGLRVRCCRSGCPPYSFATYPGWWKPGVWGRAHLR